MHNKKTILIIGPAPENIGGISIHIRRLIEYMGDSYKFDFIDEGRRKWAGRFNIRSLDLKTYLKKVKNADIIHIHSGSVILRLFNMFVAKYILKKKVIVTIHRDPNIEKCLWLTRRLTNKCDKLICVNRNGIKTLGNNRKEGTSLLLPAFIPPVIEKEPKLPEHITSKIELIKKSGGKIMVSNAWRLIMKDGIDLYGLDICIEALGELVAMGQDWHLIFVVPDPSGSEEYIQEMERRAKALKVEDRLTIYQKPLSFVRLMLQSDVVLRPTITDGDAITVREALYYDIPVVASNVVERPEAVTLHKSRDVKSLIEAILKAKPTGDTSHDAKIDYKQLYQQIYTE